jgi:hypothetical protein
VIPWFLPRWLVWIDWRWPFVHIRRGRPLHELRKIRRHAENYGGGKKVQARALVDHVDQGSSR